MPGGSQSQFTPIDENAQDYSSMGQNQEMMDMSQINYDDNGEDSFDPTEFFSSFGKNQQAAEQVQQQPQAVGHHGGDINSDLQVSDSDEEEEEEAMEEGGDFEEVEESQDNQDFNIDEFLQQ